MSDKKTEKKKEISRREIRRRKRIISQITAYAVLLSMIALLICGGYFGVKCLKNYLQQRNDEMASVEPGGDSVNGPEEQLPISEPMVEVPEPEPEPVVEEQPEVKEPETDALDAYIDQMLATMSIEDRVAGVFITTPESITGVSQAVKAGNGTKTALEKYAVGGLIYNEKNMQGEAQLRDMLTKTAEMSRYPIFMALEEGLGDDTVIGGKKFSVARQSGAAELAGDTTAAASAYLAVGAYLSDYGVNLDLAPVLDVLTNTEAVSKNDMFSGDATANAQFAASAVASLDSQGVQPCLKYFPGEGEAITLTIDGPAVTNRTADEMRACEWVPFKASIDNGAEMIMMSHISAPAVTGETTPSSLSSYMIETVLRQELGFRGVVVTDDLTKKAVSANYTSGQASVMALQAGADMIYHPDHFEEAYQAVLDAVAGGSLTEERINQALHRIYRVKYNGQVPE